MDRDQSERASRRLRWSRWLPAAVLLSTVVVAVAWPSANTFPFLAAAPVLAAPLLSLAWTIASGAGACLVWAFATATHEGEVHRWDFAGLVTVVALTAIAAFLNRMFTREREQLSTSREVAEAVQRAVLPTVPDRVRGFTVATRYQAAQEEALIGGDFYAVHDTPYGLRMVLGDVRGKGVQAVTMVNTVLGTFHAEALGKTDLPAIVHAVEMQLQDVKSRREAASYEDFATAVFAEIPPGRPVLRMANCGHPTPLRVDEGKATPLEPEEPSLPLGMGDLAGSEVRVDQFELPPGATVVLFTDGITEARDPNGVFFDPASALTASLPPDPGAVLDTMLTALTRHTERLEDDAAALALTHVPANGQGETSAGPSDERPGRILGGG